MKYQKLNFLKGKDLQRGFTLLISLLVVSVVLTVSLGVFEIMTKEIKLSGVGRESQISFYAADAGIECFYFWDIKHPDLAGTAFASRATPTTINCASTDIVIPANSAGPYQFELPLSNNSCAKVKVTKQSNGSRLTTTVESRGYNMSCDSDSTRKVERAIRLTSTRELAL